MLVWEIFLLFPISDSRIFLKNTVYMCVLCKTVLYFQLLFLCYWPLQLWTCLQAYPSVCFFTFLCGFLAWPVALYKGKPRLSTLFRFVGFV